MCELVYRTHFYQVPSNPLFSKVGTILVSRLIQGDQPFENHRIKPNEVNFTWTLFLVGTFRWGNVREHLFNTFDVELGSFRLIIESFNYFNLFSDWILSGFWNLGSECKTTIFISFLSAQLLFFEILVTIFQESNFCSKKH